MIFQINIFPISFNDELHGIPEIGIYFLTIKK